jgi:hypothetical protein
MQETPFSQTAIGFIILTIIAGLALYALQRAFDRSPGPSLLSREAPQGEDPVAAAARAQREAAEAEAVNRKAWAAAEERRRRDEEANAEFQRQQNALLAREKLQALQRQIEEAAARRAIAYRRANGGCELGTHRVCWTANASEQVRCYQTWGVIAKQTEMRLGKLRFRVTVQQFAHHVSAIGSPSGYAGGPGRDSTAVWHQVLGTSIKRGGNYGGISRTTICA